MVRVARLHTVVALFRPVAIAPVATGPAVRRGPPAPSARRLIAQCGGMMYRRIATVAASRAIRSHPLVCTRVQSWSLLTRSSQRGIGYRLRTAWAWFAQTLETLPAPQIIPLK